MNLLSKSALIPPGLTEYKEIEKEAKEISKDITIGRTLFMEKYGVSSELEYKKRMMKEKRVMRHSHIGWNSWEDTSNAFRKIYRDLTNRGYTVDRFGVILDWTMGVPENVRGQVPRSTGLCLNTPEEWKELGRIVPVHPHLGDHMIGSLNSVENVKLALSAGATTIGNISQFFTFDYPIPYKMEDRTIDMVKALKIMAEFKEAGTLVHSNLCDGFGAQFRDLANLIGWAMIEKYIVEDLIGAKLAHCFGNLFNSTISRIVFSLALDEIYDGDSSGTMTYGNTIDYTLDIDENFGVLSTFMLGDFISQMYRPTGHAITPIPVTEAMRIPTADEIIQAQVVSNQIERKAKEMYEYMNWEKILSEKNKIVIGGQVFFERVMSGLSDIGIDIKNPVELFLALRKIGTATLEEKFGVGTKVEGIRKPITPSDIRSEVEIKKVRLMKKVVNQKGSLAGLKVVLGSTDVHEYGRELVASVLNESGAIVYDLGSSVNYEEIAEMVIETGSDVIAISTFIGISLSYSRKLKEVLKGYGLDTPIIMGGLLNENQEGSGLAVDVTSQLEELGVICCTSAEEVITKAEQFMKQTTRI